MSNRSFTCATCGHIYAVKENDIATGYVFNTDGRPVCYNCLAVREKDEMCSKGKIVLYEERIQVAENSYRYELINWPGTLAFKVAGGPKRSKNNWGYERRDYWFIGPDARRWWGVNVGDNQIVRYKRTKTLTNTLGQNGLRRYNYALSTHPDDQTPAELA